MLEPKVTKEVIMASVVLIFTSTKEMLFSLVLEGHHILQGS